MRLLRADPHRHAVLTERAGPATLQTLSDTDACEVVAGLHARLHVPAMPQLSSAAEELGRWLDEQARTRTTVPRRLVDQAQVLGRDLLAAGSGTEVVLHGNLHVTTVRAADRAASLRRAELPAPFLASSSSACVRSSLILAKSAGVKICIRTHQRNVPEVSAV